MPKLTISKELYEQVKACQLRAERVASSVFGKVGNDTGSAIEGSNLSAGWSERGFNGRAFVASFSTLALKPAYATRCFLFSWSGGSRAKVFVVPESARFEPVVGEPTLETVPGSVARGQKLIQGDGSLFSYYEAAMLERSFSRVGAFWHGLPFEYGEMIVEMQSLVGWKVHQALPLSIWPEVTSTDNHFKVVYHAHKELYGEALLEITVEFEPNVYLPDTTIRCVASGPRFVVV